MDGSKRIRVGDLTYGRQRAWGGSGAPHSVWFISKEVETIEEPLGDLPIPVRIAPRRAHHGYQPL